MCAYVRVRLARGSFQGCRCWMSVRPRLLCLLSCPLPHYLCLLRTLPGQEGDTEEKEWLQNYWHPGHRYVELFSSQKTLLFPKDTSLACDSYLHSPKGQASDFYYYNFIDFFSVIPPGWVLVPYSVGCYETKERFFTRKIIHFTNIFLILHYTPSVLDLD